MFRQHRLQWQVQQDHKAKLECRGHPEHRAKLEHRVPPEHKAMKVPKGKLAKLAATQ
jgi:hypothetical protein